MKNFKLLLATTAILSTGLVMGVLAEDATPVTAATYTNRVSATLTAGISIYSPITMDSQDGELTFPTITTTLKAGADSVQVKVNYDGTIDYANSTAQIVQDDASVTEIIITGGNIGNISDVYKNKTQEETIALDEQFNNDGVFNAVNTVSVSDTIPLYVYDGDSSSPKPLCGTVKSLEPWWHFNTALNSGKGGLELRFGGTFELENGFEPTNGHARCQGSTTVTYIMAN